MKKVLAIIMTLVLALGLSVTAFAAPSPAGDQIHKVVVKQSNSGSAESNNVKDGDSFTVKSDSSKGSFDNWSIFKKDGTPAVEGVDYEIVEGSLDSPSLTIKPKSDISVCGNYNKETTTPPTAADFEANSPATGDFSAFYLIALMLGALGVGFVAKKQFAR